MSFPRAMLPGTDLRRLHSVLTCLPRSSAALRVLNVGCGAYPAAPALHDAFPGWHLWGLDRDLRALRAARRHTPSLTVIAADLDSLPGLLRGRFGLVLVRHPDLFRSSAWGRAMPRLPGLLAPGGVLVIALYAPDEVEAVRGLALPHRMPLDERRLAPAGLAGQDRFVLAYNLPQ